MAVESKSSTKTASDGTTQTTEIKEVSVNVTKTKPDFKDDDTDEEDIEALQELAASEELK